MGWDLADLAKEIDVPVTSLTNLESKEYEIEIKKLEKTAKILQRPTAVFFLPAPPGESEITDYRKIPNSKKKLSKDTCKAIRDARYWQSISKNLLKELHSKSLPIRHYSMKNTPSNVAITEREKLGFESENLQIKTPDKLYNKLRTIIESYDIFVHQFNLGPDGIRGFTLPDGPPYAIVVNTKEKPQAGSFTLLHEYAHILLKKVGICSPNSETLNPKNQHDIERWCNKFAGAFLLPEEKFLNLIDDYDKKNIKLDDMIHKLALHFKVSDQAVMIRVIELNPYTALAKHCRDRYNKTSKSPPSGGGNYYIKCKNQRGVKFIKLVLDSKERRLINYRDVADYLDLRLKNLPKLEKVIYGNAS